MRNMIIFLNLIGPKHFLTASNQLQENGISKKYVYFNLKYVV